MLQKLSSPNTKTEKAIYFYSSESVVAVVERVTAHLLLKQVVFLEITIHYIRPLTIDRLSSMHFAK